MTTVAEVLTEDPTPVREQRWMRRSDGIVDIATALATAQAKFKPAQKRRTVSVKSERGAFTYNYADLADIIDAIRPALSEHGLSFLQTCCTLASGSAVAVTTLLMHQSGQWIESTLIMAVADLKPQTLGSIITYARRYALSCMVGIASEEDDDARQAQDAAELRRTEEQRAEVERRNEQKRADTERRQAEAEQRREQQAKTQQRRESASGSAGTTQIPHSWIYEGTPRQDAYVTKVLQTVKYPEELWKTVRERLMNINVNELPKICSEVRRAAGKNGSGSDSDTSASQGAGE